MHQSFETLGGWPGAFTFYASESKWILASENGMPAPPPPYVPHGTPFFKKTEELKIMFYSLLEFL